MVGGIVGDKIDRHSQGLFDIQPQTAELEQGHDAAFFDFQIYVAVTARRAFGIRTEQTDAAQPMCLCNWCDNSAQFFNRVWHLRHLPVLF